MYLENVDRRMSLRPQPLARMRPARTSPPTFLFLPIHFSNSPGFSRIPLLRVTQEPSKPAASDRGRRPFTEISVRCFEDAPSLSGGAPIRGLYVSPSELVNSEAFKSAAKMPVFRPSRAPRGDLRGQSNRWGAGVPVATQDRGSEPTPRPTPAIFWGRSGGLGRKSKS